MSDTIRDKRNTKIVIYCEECEFRRIIIHDYKLTGEYPHDRI